MIVPRWPFVLEGVLLGHFKIVMAIAQCFKLVSVTPKDASARFRVKPLQQRKVVSVFAREGLRGAIPKKSVFFEQQFCILQRLEPAARDLLRTMREHIVAHFQMRFFGLLHFGKSGLVVAEPGKSQQSGVIIGRFLVAIFARTRHFERSSDRLGARLQFFNPFCNGGDSTGRSVHKRLQLELNGAIGAGEIRVNEESVLIGQGFCRLPNFRQ